MKSNPKLRVPNAPRIAVTPMKRPPNVLHKYLCPQCREPTEVIDSRVGVGDDVIRRRRRCRNNHRFSTLEVAVDHHVEFSANGLFHDAVRKLVVKKLRLVADEIETGRDYSTRRVTHEVED